MKKTIVITGGVTSGVGKGVLTAAVSNLLKKQGLKVQPVKFDGLLNKSFADVAGYHRKQQVIFSGEEIFVLEDGTETDSDLGVYERFTNQNLKRTNNIVNGSCLEEMLFGKMIREGELIKIRPHLMKVYEERLRAVARDNDVVVLEVGGTVGDDENSFFLDFLGTKSGQESRNYLSLHLTCVPQDESRNYEVESKLGIIGGKNLLKPVKNSILELAKHNLFPQIVCLRGRNIGKGEIKRISEATGIYENSMFVIPEINEIYTLPKILEENNLFSSLLTKIGTKAKRFTEKDHVDRYLEEKVRAGGDVKLLVVGDTESWSSYASLNEAIKHSAAELGCTPNVEWYQGLSSQRVQDYDGVIITEGLEAIDKKLEIARTSSALKKPLLAISAGAQIVFAYLERHNNSGGLKRTLTDGGGPFIKTPLVTGVRKNEIDRRSMFHEIVGEESTIGRHRHDIEINYKPTRVVRVSARYRDCIDAFEYMEDNNWILGTSFHPEYNSRPGKPNKIISAFIERCANKK